MMEYKSGDTVVGIVKEVEKKSEKSLQRCDYELVDMTTMVIVGNKETYVKNGKMITPRGYTL
ncbi:Cobalt-precorrin-3B C(17)-methyltransferase [Listeria monocytogenes]|nr:Cobalt-precorrin-3B C(17)-methyltransferase [Listeria monocytogenes]